MKSKELYDKEMHYKKYFKDVSNYDVVDVYRVHRLFGVRDEVLCHASKKLLLSGVRTGGKTLEQDVREARDSLNRWLEMLAEDLCNEQEAAAFTGKPAWTDETRIDTIGLNWIDGTDGAAFPEYTLEEVVGGAELSDWAKLVAVDDNGEVWEYEDAPELNSHYWCNNSSGRAKRINGVAKPTDFKSCIWEIKK